jgi:antitoxin (DNA-binding transcriptional repressor) of toxin-antitoxin stability system
LGRRKPQILTSAAANFVGKTGKPMSRLVPLVQKVRPKRFGTLKGKIRVPDDFNDPLPAEILATFGSRTSRK